MSFVKHAVILGSAAFALLSGTIACAADVVIEIDPGLYAYQSSGFIGPQPFLEKDYEYCLTPDMTKRTLSEIVAELQDGGNCTISNVTHRDGYGEADAVCQSEGFGTARGTIKIDYTKTSYNVRGNATVDANGMSIPISSKVDARRIGDCPPGWTPPPGISHK